MIDVHAHLFFDALLGKAGVYGPEVVRTDDGHFLRTGSMTWPLASPESLEVDPHDRVKALDDASIDTQIVSISPLWMFHHAPHEIAESFAAAANDYLAQWCSATDGRALFMAQLPVQRPKAAVEELHRAVTQHGAIAAYFASDARTFLDDVELDPIYSACEELDVPLFIHSAMPGIDGPNGDARLERWIGQAVIGYPLEDTVATTTFLLSDVLDRHPDLDVCLSHGGGATAMFWGRLSAFARTARSPVTEGVLRSHMDRLWFDAHVHSQDCDNLLHRVSNPDHLVFGSNFGGWDSESPESANDKHTSNASVLLRLKRRRTLRR